MLAFGILFVVMGHKYQIQWLYFPAYSFQVAFFFFISGYLFKIKIAIKEKIKFVEKKIVTQLLPYFLINAIFFLITTALKSENIILSKELDLNTFFIMPFITGHQNAFIIPLWFLLNLFLVNIIVQGIYWSETKRYKLMLSIPILIVSLFAVYKGLNLYTDYRLTLVRSSYALLFFQLGVLLKTFKNKIDKWLFNPLILLILWGIVTLITNSYGRITYSIVWGTVVNPEFYIPIITTILIVLISYSVCYYISNFVKENSMLLLIGQKSFWIMSFHLAVFFVVNIIFYKLGYFDKSNLSNIYFRYNVGQTFFFYLIPAIVMPVIIGVLFQKVKPKLLLIINPNKFFSYRILDREK